MPDEVRKHLTRLETIPSSRITPDPSDSQLHDGASSLQFPLSFSTGFRSEDWNGHGRSLALCYGYFSFLYIVICITVVIYNYCLLASLLVCFSTLIICLSALCVVLMYWKLLTPRQIRCVCKTHWVIKLLSDSDLWMLIESMTAIVAKQRYGPGTSSRNIDPQHLEIQHILHCHTWGTFYPCVLPHHLQCLLLKG